MTPTIINLATSVVGNTTSELPILVGTIPANVFEDGALLQLTGRYRHSNTSGSAAHLTFRVYFGANCYVLYSSAPITATQLMAGLTLHREGADLHLRTAAGPQLFTSSAAGSSPIAATWQPDFGSDNDLRITVQWDVANSLVTSTAYFGKALLV